MTASSVYLFFDAKTLFKLKEIEGNKIRKRHIVYYEDEVSADVKKPSEEELGFGNV